MRIPRLFTSLAILASIAPMAAISNMEAKPVASTCAVLPVSVWYATAKDFKVLNGCTLVTGVVSDIHSADYEGHLASYDKRMGIVQSVAASHALDESVAFLMKPDPGSRLVLNAHNLVYQHGDILVNVATRNLIHGALRNGSHVQVRAPLVHNLVQGYNELVSVASVRVLPSAKPKIAAPSPAPAAAFTVRAVVTPDSMPYDAHPTLTAYTSAGASCTAGVVYSTGRTPVSFHGYPESVSAGGSVSWGWHEETKGTGGTATVDCTFGSRSAEAQADFAVTG